MKIYNKPKVTKITTNKGNLTTKGKVLLREKLMPEKVYEKESKLVIKNIQKVLDVSEEVAKKKFDAFFKEFIKINEQTVSDINYAKGNFSTIIKKLERYMNELKLIKKKDALKNYMNLILKLEKANQYVNQRKLVSFSNIFFKKRGQGNNLFEQTMYALGKLQNKVIKTEISKAIDMFSDLHIKLKKNKKYNGEVEAEFSKQLYNLIIVCGKKTKTYTSNNVDIRVGNWLSKELLPSLQTITKSVNNKYK